MPRRGSNPPVLKKYGQHFLSDKAILDRLADALGPTATDTVVEIGPGRGSLTEILAKRAVRLVAVEIDRALAAQLRDRYAAQKKVEIVEGDVLETDLRRLGGEDYLLIGNVPYYITTPILFKALEFPMPRRTVFLVQGEVADRLSASAGSDSYGAMTVNVGVVANVETVLNVPAEAFQPPPKVDSAAVRLTPRPAPLVAPDLLPAFRTFVQAAFGLRRKQMHRVLRTVRGVTVEDATRILEGVEIEPACRPEVIDPQKFVELFLQLQARPDTRQ